MKTALGLDFGTESVRAVLVDLRGRELAPGVALLSVFILLLLRPRTAPIT